MRQPDFIDDQELVLYYYSESEHQSEIDETLRSSTELQRRYAELRAVLDAVKAPEPPLRSDLYGHEVWKRVYPNLEVGQRSPTNRTQARRMVGWAIAATLLIVASFWAGRETAVQVDEVVEEAIADALSEQARDRILLAEVASHLERSQFLILELSHTDANHLDADRLAAARALKADSRLYRQAAQRSGENEVAFVLQELEIFLTELGHLSPDATTDLEALLSRLDDNNLLFKVRVLESRIEQRSKPANRGPTT